MDFSENFKSLAAFSMLRVGVLTLLNIAAVIYAKGEAAELKWSKF